MNGDIRPPAPDAAPRCGVARLLPRRSELPLLLFRPGTFLNRYAVPLALLLLGALLDALTTWSNVRLFGAGVELHPVQRLVFEAVGPTVGVPLAKGIQLAFVLFVAAWWQPWCRWVLAGCGVLYAVAAASNHFQWL